MIGLGGLGQLLLITHQQDRFGAPRHHQQVELLRELISAEHPGGTANYCHFI